MAAFQIDTLHEGTRAGRDHQAIRSALPKNVGLGADSPCQGEMSRSDKGGREVAPERPRRKPQVFPKSHGPRRFFGFFLIAQKETRPVGRNLCFVF